MHTLNSSRTDSILPRTPLGKLFLGIVFQCEQDHVRLLKIQGVLADTLKAFKKYLYFVVQGVRDGK